jgi:hypothetical protein
LYLFLLYFIMPIAWFISLYYFTTRHFIVELKSSYRHVTPPVLQRLRFVFQLLFLILKGFNNLAPGKRSATRGKMYAQNQLAATDSSFENEHLPSAKHIDNLIPNLANAELRFAPFVIRFYLNDSSPLIWNKARRADMSVE